MIMNAIVQTAQPIVNALKASGAPDPSFLLALPNTVEDGSNLLAVQKIYDGAFQFDIFYDAPDVEEKLDCGWHKFVLVLLC
jgi:mannosyl-oligosaccharide glucosidase